MWRAQMPKRGLAGVASSAVRRRPLGGELDQRRAVGDPCRGGCRLGVAGAGLERERAPVPGAGTISSAPKRNAISPRAAEAAQAGRGQDDARRPRRRRACEPGVDVAAELDDVQVGPQREKLRAAAQAGGADPGARRAASASDRRSPTKASAGSSRPGTPTSARLVGHVAREVLRRVDAEIGLAVEQRRLDRADEPRLVAGVAPSTLATRTSSAPPSARATARPGRARGRSSRVAILTGACGRGGASRAR